MTYPLSDPVTAGQPTAASHYNNLRSDALLLGNTDADSVQLGLFLALHAQNINLIHLSTTRIRCQWLAAKPPTLTISGCMLKNISSADLPVGVISGAAATWYIFAVRIDNHTTFSITANTSPIETTDQRLIGECYWTGTAIGYIQSYLGSPVGFPAADYDSGWFAVTYNSTYTKAHGFGIQPSLVILEWSASSTGAGTVVPVTMVYATTPALGTYDPLYYDETNIVAKSGDSSSYDATCHSRIAQSAAGYWHIRAYK